MVRARIVSPEMVVLLHIVVGSTCDVLVSLAVGILPLVPIPSAGIFF